MVNKNDKQTQIKAYCKSGLKAAFAAWFAKHKFRSESEALRELAQACVDGEVTYTRGSFSNEENTETQPPMDG